MLRSPQHFFARTLRLADDDSKLLHWRTQFASAHEPPRRHPQTMDVYADKRNSRLRQYGRNDVGNAVPRFLGIHFVVQVERPRRRDKTSVVFVTPDINDLNPGRGVDQALHFKTCPTR